MSEAREIFKAERLQQRLTGETRRKVRLEMCRAVLYGPALAIGALVLTLALQEGSDVPGDYFQVFMPLMFPSIVLLTVSIFLDAHASAQLTELAATKVRFVLSTTAMISLLFLSVWVTGEADDVRANEVVGIVVFICLPTLLICAALLWFTIMAIKRASLQALLLAGFVLATVCVEWRSQTGPYGDTEDQVLMLHSLLVALAVAFRLCVWGAKSFSCDLMEEIS